MALPERPGVWLAAGVCASVWSGVGVADGWLLSELQPDRVVTAMSVATATVRRSNLAGGAQEKPTTLRSSFSVLDVEVLRMGLGYIVLAREQ